MINRSVVFTWAAALALIAAFWSIVLYIGIHVIGRFW